MDAYKTDNEPPPLDSSSRDPTGDKAYSDAQMAAKKLDDLIEVQRKDSANKRLERQQSRRISSFPTHRNLKDISPTVTPRKLSYDGNAKNPPTTDSSIASQSERKEPSSNLETTKTSKTSKNFQLELEAKARARGLRSSPSVRKMGASNPSVHDAGAKKPPPPPAVGLNEPTVYGPGRKLSRGEFQPSRIPHFVPSRLQSSEVELEMGELNHRRSFHNSMGAYKGNGDDSKRPTLLNPSNSVRRLPAPSFRRNNFARESSMAIIHRSATSDSRDLDELIAYKTGIPLDDPSEEDERKPAATPAASSREDDASEDDNGVDLQIPETPHAAVPPCTVVPSMSGMTNNRDLDQLIAYKTGIPLQGSTEEGTGEEVAPAVEKTEILKNGDYPNQMVKHRDLEGAGILGSTGEHWVEEADLAIAIEVEEDMDEDAFIPSAIQYGPDAKMPIYKNRRFRFCFAFLFGIVAVAIAGTFFFPAQPDSAAEGELPTEPTKTQSIKSVIEVIVGREKLEDRNTPHSAALDWITNVDKLQLEAGNRRLIQRYVLALFHFQTSNWYSCGTESKIMFDGEDGCLYQELVSFFPHRYRSVPSYRWLSNRHECEWAGVRCAENIDMVTRIGLVGQNIRGNLPKEFKEIDSLDTISLAWNDLTGTIPEEYGDLKMLRSFHVHYNQLTGTLPKSFFVQMRKLVVLNVGQNFLTGTIPPSIKTMVGLRGLYLFNNLFRGEIPDEIGELPILQFLRLDKNFLKGTLPATLGRLNLDELWISQQDISGQLPSELGNIQRMQVLDLHSTSLNGTIPEEFYNITDLQTVDLQDTSLSGTLSSNIGRWTDLRELRINDSRLSGPLPTELGELSKLGELWVQGNNFDGVVPIEVCNLKEFEGLEVVNADCLPTDESGIAQISCDCCNSCCNPESKACKPVGE